jgi:hypothetical protein
MFGTKRQPKVPEIFINDLSYGRAEEQADMDHFQKIDLLDSKNGIDY